MSADSLPDDVLAAFDPGVRDLVVALHEAGFAPATRFDLAHRAYEDAVADAVRANEAWWKHVHRLVTDLPVTPAERRRIQEETARLRAEAMGNRRYAEWLREECLVVLRSLAEDCED